MAIKEESELEFELEHKMRKKASRENLSNGGRRSPEYFHF